MAQSILLPTPAMPHIMPNSPDPTPLRMLAFSVAEAALSSNPNSPFFFAEPKVPTAPRFVPARNESWQDAVQADWREWNGGVKSIAERRGKAVWDVLEKAEERKEKSELNDPVFLSLHMRPRLCDFQNLHKAADAIDSHFIETNVVTVSPPISPSSYNFTLPANSQLAASIARNQAPQVPSPKPTRAFTNRNPMPLYTCSAEPSPTRSTFSGLDQTRPPPEFVPRLTAKEFSQQAQKTAADLAATRERRRSGVEPLSAAALAEHLAATEAPVIRASRRSSRLPSLQQIQAKISGTAKLRRSGSVGALPAVSLAVRPTSPRTESFDSFESLELRTPDEEVPNPLLRDRRLALQIIMKGRPATPPSPGIKEPRLSSFLRERTNGRLAGVSKIIVASPEKMTTPEKIIRPVLKVTPPSYESRPAIPPLHLGRATQVSPTKPSFPFRSGFSTPTESRFSHPLSHLSTPPRSDVPSPTSPTGSIRSNRSSANGSPTLSMPIITCTPAPPVILRDGLEQDSDDGSEASGDVMLFDGEAEERDREEREKRGAEMRAKLLRRRSSE